MKTTRLLTLVILTILLFLTGSGGRISRAQHHCGQPTECVNSQVRNTCIPVPTTLPSVNVNLTGDWYVDSPNSHCGAYRCYYLFSCECGSPLSSRLCTSAEKRDA